MSASYPIVRCGVRCRCPDLDPHQMPPCWFAQILNRHSPDDSRTGVNIRAFPVSLEDRREVRTPTGPLRQPERLVEGLIWPSFWHLDALLPSVALERRTVERLMLALVVAAAAVPDEPQNLLEHLPWDG